MEYKGEEFVTQIFNNLCKETRKINPDGGNLFLGWHFGYYDQDVHTFRKSLHQMNKYVEDLLALDDTSSRIVLDAGCGLGGMVTHLAKTHPESQFYGIALGSEEVARAQSVQSYFNLKNAAFSQQSYLKTNFPDDFFDVIYALESVSCGINDAAFCAHMKKILKPNGRLIILDLFPRVTRTSFVDIIREHILHINLQDHPQRTIHSFRACLAETGFTLLSETDLKKQRHVRNILATSLVLLYIELSTEIKGRKKKVMSLPFLVVRFAFQYIVNVLLLIILDFGYFSLTTVKNPNIE
jgi:2-polyprenyl-3-methyl-5-hydroxy-6-metoxy-1,4-benzoquinol methylase